MSTVEFSNTVNLESTSNAESTANAESTSNAESSTNTSTESKSTATNTTAATIEAKVDNVLLFESNPENDYHVLLLKGYDVATKEGYTKYKDALNVELERARSLSSQISSLREYATSDDLKDQQDKMFKGAVDMLQALAQSAIALEKIVEWLTKNKKLESQKKNKYEVEYNRIKIQYGLDIATYDGYNKLTTTLSRYMASSDFEKYEKQKAELGHKTVKEEMMMLPHVVQWLAENKQ